jgi:uncharacterized membrane protein
VIAPSQDHHPAGTLTGGTGTGTVDSEVEVEASGTERVVTFSDAVVAIAITLLALGLTAPVSTKGMTYAQLLHQLRDGWPADLAFLISFAVIGNHWAAHRRVFRYVCRMNGLVSRLNMLWLLMMVLTPFATNLLSGSGGFGVRFAIYALIQVIAAGCLLLMSREFARAGLLRPDAPERARHPDTMSLLAVCVSFLVSIPVAFATSWAYALWAAIPLTARVLRRLTANGRHAHE